ncbi:MAG: hypothetical protein KGJ34_01755 [Patescibacteria group bacterium]|nr:hypothetical protein [Patescibacteria group bacterium]
MEIIIPEYGVGLDVQDFLKSELDQLQIVEALHKMEGYQKLTHLQLGKGGKLENLGEGLYKLEVPIANLKLRFFGTFCSGQLVLGYVFKKKTKRIPKKELEKARSRISQIDCQIIAKLKNNQTT